MAYVEPYGSKKPPISAHPLFPAVVALWFAALFGMGSLVLPNILIERAIALSGLESLVPSAAPPLGVTARIAISSAVAIVGCLVGFAIARKVARAQAPARPAGTGRHRHNSELSRDLGARRPISAHEELGATRLATPQTAAADPVLAGRRRALAMDEDDRPSAFLQAAPLPGADPYPAAAQPAREAEPLDLAGFAQQEPQPQPVPESASPLASLRNSVPTRAEHPQTTAPVGGAQFEQPPFGQGGMDQGFRPPPPLAQPFAPPAEPLPPAFARAPAAEPAPPPFAPPAAATGVDPLEPFRAPAFADEPEVDEDEEMFPLGAAAFRPAPPPVPDPLPFVAPSQALPAQPAQDFAEESPLAFCAPSQAKAQTEVAQDPPPAPQPAEPEIALASEPLDQLSMVDLAERLASSLGQHGGHLRPPPAGLVAALGAQIGIGPAPTGEAFEGAEAPQAFDQPMGRNVPRPPVIPEALRPIPLELEEFGEDEDDFDLNLSFVQHTRANPAPTPGVQLFISDPLDEAGEVEDEYGDEEDEQAAEDAAYSSLLAMRSPFRGSVEYVRVETPEAEDSGAEPAVVFPGQTAAVQSVEEPTASVSTAPANGHMTGGEAQADPQARRFDAPGSVAALEAPAANRPRVDRDEAERSLRSALATLQRMSGAA